VSETRVRMTANDLLSLPDDGKHYELVEGELIEMSPAGGEHGFVAGRAFLRLGTFIEQSELGGAVFAAETGFHIAHDPDTVRAPDVAYVGEARLAQARVAGFPRLVPDLVVEVVSPGDSASEVQAKVDDWLRAGAQLVWVMYPTLRSMVVHLPGGEARVLHADDELRGEPVLPGFSRRVADFFQR
jgi:Uma2 family endonuclease